MDPTPGDSSHIPEFDPEERFRHGIRNCPRPRSADDRDRNIRRAIRHAEYELAEWEKVTGRSGEHHRARLVEIRRSAMQRRSILFWLRKLLDGA
jgi:hypothetical protein